MYGHQSKNIGYVAAFHLSFIVQGKLDSKVCRKALQILWLLFYDCWQNQESNWHKQLAECLKLPSLQTLKSFSAWSSNLRKHQHNRNGLITPVFRWNICLNKHQHNSKQMPAFQIRSHASSASRKIVHPLPYLPRKHFNNHGIFLTRSSIDASSCFQSAEYAPYWLAQKLEEDMYEQAKTVHKSEFLASHSQKMNY